MRPTPLPCDCPVHGAQGQLAKRSQEGDPVLGDVRAAQVSPVGEEETTKTQARKAKKQQDQSGTDQRRVVGQAEMQVVPCLAAAHGEQRGLSLRKQPGLARTEQMFISFLFLWVIWIFKTRWDKAKITTGKIEVPAL